MIGAKILGPRIGKYDKNGKPQAILGHNLTFAALGVFILWFCWFGFNGASTVGMDSDALIETAGRVFFNTNLAAAVACCAALIFTWIRYKKPDVSMTYNAALAGLVGITAGCDAVDAVGAAVIGVVCGILIVLAIEFFDKIAKIDDPVGAVSVLRRCRNGSDRSVCHRGDYRGRTFLWRRRALSGNPGIRRACCSSVCCGGYHHCIFSN